MNLAVIAGVDTPDMTSRYEQMGVECVILNQHTANRNFELLTAIKKKCIAN